MSESLTTHCLSSNGHDGHNEWVFVGCMERSRFWSAGFSSRTDDGARSKARSRACSRAESGREA